MAPINSDQGIRPRQHDGLSDSPAERPAYNNDQVDPFPLLSTRLPTILMPFNDA